MKVHLVTVFGAGLALACGAHFLAVDERVAAKQSATFLAEANNILRTDPVDGNFGMNRLPTVHSRQYFSEGKSPEAKAARAIAQLEKTHFIALIAYGKPSKDEFGRRSTMSGYYQLNHAPLAKDKRFFDAADAVNNRAMSTALKLVREGKDRWRESISYVDRQATIEYQAVRASHNSCMKCHQDVPKGKPIGVLVLIRVPRN